MGIIPDIEICDNLCYSINFLFMEYWIPPFERPFTYDSSCKPNYLYLRAQIEMLYGNKGVYRGLVQYEIYAEKYLLIGVAQLTKREPDRGKETFSCPSESTRKYTLSTED